MHVRCHRAQTGSLSRNDQKIVIDPLDMYCILIRMCCASIG